MDMECSTKKQEDSIRYNGKIINNMGLVTRSGQIKQNTWENFNKEQKMVKENTYGLMEVGMMENGRMMLFLGKENII